MRLVGEALPPAVLAVNPDSYDFGTVIGGDTSVTEFDLANVDCSDLEWSADLVYPEARLSEGETTYEELRLLCASGINSNTERQMPFVMSFRKKGLTEQFLQFREIKCTIHLSNPCFLEI